MSSQTTDVIIARSRSAKTLPIAGRRSAGGGRRRRAHSDISLNLITSSRVPPMLSTKPASGRGCRSFRFNPLGSAVPTTPCDPSTGVTAVRGNLMSATNDPALWKLTGTLDPGGNNIAFTNVTVDTTHLFVGNDYFQRITFGRLTVLQRDFPGRRGYGRARQHPQRFPVATFSLFMDDVRRGMCYSMPPHSTRTATDSGLAVQISVGTNDPSLGDATPGGSGPWSVLPATVWSLSCLCYPLTSALCLSPSAMLLFSGTSALLGLSYAWRRRRSRSVA